MPATVNALRQSLSDVRAALRDGGVSEWEVEADVLLRMIVGAGRADFLSLVYGGESALSPSQRRRLDSLIARRLGGEPLAYIAGRREFYGLDLEVNENVLVPRQETELLVELTLERLSGDVSAPTVVDVGTGSGAIALAVAVNFRGARIVGVDISALALKVAMRNRECLSSVVGPLDVEFVLGDTLTAIGGPVNVIVSNPPYIPSGTLDSLPTEVRREPVMALDGGADGLDHFRRLVSQADRILAPGGALIVELMPERMDAAAEITRGAMGRAESVIFRRDLMGNRRALVAQMRGPRL